MLHAFLMLVALQLLGELLVHAIGLPVPGMVVGLLLLLGILGARARLLGAAAAVPAGLDAAAKGLHGHFGLLFVPAGVGVLAQADLIAREGTAILAAILVSTVLAIGVAARLALPRRRGATAAPGRRAVELTGRMS